MELLEQCERWLEADDYHRVIVTLEALPDEDLTAELKLVLGRAYIGLAKYSKVSDRVLYEKALSLFKTFGPEYDEHTGVVFGLAMAYFGLDQDSRALTCAEKLTQWVPDKKVFKELKKNCRGIVSVPLALRPFSQRVHDMWREFEEKDLEIRTAMAGKSPEDAEAIVREACQAIFKIAFTEIEFSVLVYGVSIQIIFPLETSRLLARKLEYCLRAAPASILEHWYFTLGVPANPYSLIQVSGVIVDPNQVQVWFAKDDPEDDTYSLEVFFEPLNKLKFVQDPQRYILYRSIAQEIGEVAFMNYVGHFGVLDAPKDTPPILLSQLPEEMESLGLSLDVDIKTFLEERGSAYRIDPKQVKQGNGFRRDILLGRTLHMPLLDDYTNGETTHFDLLYDDGIVAGFFVFNLGGFELNKGAEKFVRFIQTFKEVFSTPDAQSFMTVTGDAIGQDFGYIDIIAWDLKKALEQCEAFFSESDLKFVAFKVFRQGCDPVGIKDTTKSE